MSASDAESHNDAGLSQSPTPVECAPETDPTVLVVDDSEYMRRLLGTMLAGLGGVRRVEVEDAHHALDVLRRRRIDAIITDHKMLPMDGLAFVRMVRRGIDIAKPDVPIIMLTGYTGAELRHEARIAGVSSFIVKPVSFKVLRASLSYVLRRSFEATACIMPDPGPSS
ncbi:MAG: response regulator [Alphaproteobacteria bacterium]|nr:response regulator [Alphaproteobacteria bacterium]